MPTFSSARRAQRAVRGVSPTGGASGAAPGQTLLWVRRSCRGTVAMEVQERLGARTGRWFSRFVGAERPRSVTLARHACSSVSRPRHALLRPPSPSRAGRPPVASPASAEPLQLVENARVIACVLVVPRFVPHLTHVDGDAAPTCARGRCPRRPTARRRAGSRPSESVRGARRSASGQPAQGVGPQLLAVSCRSCSGGPGVRSSSRCEDVVQVEFEASEERRA